MSYKDFQEVLKDSCYCAFDDFANELMFLDNKEVLKNRYFKYDDNENNAAYLEIGFTKVNLNGELMCTSGLHLTTIDLLTIIVMYNYAGYYKRDILFMIIKSALHSFYYTKTNITFNLQDLSEEENLSNYKIDLIEFYSMITDLEYTNFSDLIKKARVIKDHLKKGEI